MSEKLETLEDIQRAYPAVFEYRERLLREIAQVETEYMAAKNRRELTDERGLEQGYYDVFRQTLVPIRQELEAINKEIVSLAAGLPPKPMTIPYP